MTVAYVYKWSNKITGKWYIGSRTAKNCHPDDGYICSSRKLKPIILESKDEWLREILCIGEPEDMLTLEAKYLSVLDAKHDLLSYNMHNGDGKFTTAGKEAWNKGKPGKKGMVPWNKGKVCPTISTGCSKRPPPPNKGKPMSDEQKAKISAKRAGQPSPKKGLPGKPQTAEANAARSAALKGRVSHRKGKTVGPYKKKGAEAPL